MRLRFRDQRGVDVQIENYGKTESAPFYEPMYEALEGAGYVRDRDIRVAGYDSRLTPDMRNFLNRTKRADRGHVPRQRQPRPCTSSATRTDRSTSSTCSRTRHSAGRTSTSTASRRSPGNFPGQGVLYPLFFTGLDVTDFTFPTTPETALVPAPR